MDMYTENNGGFQVLEGMTPFDEGYQDQGADGFVSEPYQETVAEAAYYGGTEGAGNFPTEQYQETAAEYEPAAYMEELDALPVGPEQMQVPETENLGMYQDMVSEMEVNDSGQAELSETEDGTEQEEIPETEDDSEQEETLEMEETEETAEPETEEAESAANAEDDEESKRAKHEAAEAERKAEWEARQQAKKDALRKQQEELACMSEEEIVRRSMQRISMLDGILNGVATAQSPQIKISL